MTNIKILLVSAIALASLILLLLLPGCAGRTAPTQSAVTIAGCLIVDRLPAAAGYLRAAAEVFRTASAETPPDPKALGDALAGIPNVHLSPAQQTALWSAVTLAYDLAYTGRDPANLAPLRAQLAAVAVALDAAVDTCGPRPVATFARAATPAPEPAIDSASLHDLAHAISHQIK